MDISLIQMVRRYWEANKEKPSRGENWLRVLIALGQETHPTLEPYTAAEARASEQVWSGWRPVREALERIERHPESPPIVEKAVAAVDRPGSPEWRRAQYANVDFDSLPTWGYREAKDYYSAEGRTRYCAPAHIQGRLCWLGFFADDDGNERQGVGPSPILALFAKG